MGLFCADIVRNPFQIITRRDGRHDSKTSFGVDKNLDYVIVPTKGHKSIVRSLARNITWQPQVRLNQ
jgi:hypothetical protein